MKDVSLKSYLRLRQICLVAPALEPVAQTIKKVFRIPECHRDPGVEKFGLENVLFAFGNTFIEIVAPLREGTAAGRFLQRSEGSGGYMAIFDCNDPERRKERALALGIRIAHEMSYPGFRGIQLHPADCRATMLEFDHTLNGESIDGPYYPAGPHWQESRRPEQVSGIDSIEIESPEPSSIAQHWSKLMDVPLKNDAGGVAVLSLDFGSIRFIKSSSSSFERLAAINVMMPNAPSAMEAAQAAGCLLVEGGFELAGVRFQLAPTQPQKTPEQSARR